MADTASLQGKHILLGVTGGVAAYKAAELARQLKGAGSDVRVVMSRGAAAFIAPLTFQALTGQPVAMDLLDAGQESAMGISTWRGGPTPSSSPRPPPIAWPSCVPDWPTICCPPCAWRRKRPSCWRRP
ncbi:flavoprotein [Methylogaea oryzae]|uniref:flavoprotein n=1 Tax=Methylogaea oryzae TaxID=1295382 RepID=UPI0006D1E21A